MRRRQAAAAERRTGGDGSIIVSRARAPRPDPEMVPPANGVVRPLAVQELAQNDSGTTFEGSPQAGDPAHADAPRGVRGAGRDRQERRDAWLHPWEGRARVQPTGRTSSADIFHYEIKKPMVTDRICALEKADAPGPFKQPPAGASRRGLGCAVLKLGDQAHKRKQVASVFSMIGGNMIVKYRLPHAWSAWPILTLKFSTVTTAVAVHCDSHPYPLAVLARKARLCPRPGHTAARESRQALYDYRPRTDHHGTQSRKDDNHTRSSMRHEGTTPSPGHSGNGRVRHQLPAPPGEGDQTSMRRLIRRTSKKVVSQ